MQLTEELQNKWQPILEHSDLPEIKDPHKRQVTAALLENTELALKEQAQFAPQYVPLNQTMHPTRWRGQR